MPSIKIQTEIADRLDQAQARVDQLTKALDRQVNLLQEHRQALITAAVTGQLDVAKAVA